MGRLVLSEPPSVSLIMRCRAGVIDPFVALLTLPVSSIIPAMGGAARGASGGAGGYRGIQKGVEGCSRVHRVVERCI